VNTVTQLRRKLLLLFIGVMFLGAPIQQAAQASQVGGLQRAHQGTSPFVHSPTAVRAAAPSDASLITFSEFPTGTTISNQYANRGVIFGGDSPFISNDDSNPTSPVLSGTPRFTGAIEGYFVDPSDQTRRTIVSSFQVDAGYFDATGSTRLVWFDPSGQKIGELVNSKLGLETFEVSGGSIASWRFEITQPEANGFAIDNFSLVPAVPPDLTTTAFEYQVPASRRPLNSPVASNASYSITAKVENIGSGPAESFTVTVYLSSDATIDPQRDHVLESVTVPELAAGASTTVQIDMEPPSTWAPGWSGVVTIGLVIDPQRLLPDIDFTNNQNRGVGVDSQPLQLYDPVPPVSTRASGLTYRQALLWMARNRFVPQLPGTGRGWTRPLSPRLRIRSPFDGGIRNGLAYRQDAGIYPVRRGVYRIDVSGTATFGEPAPLTTLVYGRRWLSYVRDWHDRY